MADRLSIWRGMPWFDAAGRFSPLKLAIFVFVCLPAIWMAIEFSSGRWDFPSPYVGLIYHSGLWATYLLLASLAVTPLRRILAWGPLAQLRRMLGVACFFYCALHVLAWFGLRFWDWGALLGELLGRPTLWVASASIIVLLALAATSFDSIMRRMGGSRWKQLHRLVYGAAFLAVLHFLMSPGSLQGIPFLMAGGYVWLMGWRLLDKRQLGTSAAALASLGLIATGVTMLLQPVWLVTFQAERNTQTAWAALADNFNPDIWLYLGVPPVWIMLAWTMATTSIAWLRSTRTLPQTISRSKSNP
jgi:sulfoxide reductase heme-binding subunit YedZ